MVRVPACLALVSLMALSLAACGSPETTPAADQATTAEPAAEQAPLMPDDAPPQEEEVAPEEAGVTPAAGSACTTEIGGAAAARLVKRCIAVSPATHPPCNAINPCEMIQGEIDRSCEMYGPGETKPAECSA